MRSVRPHVILIPLLATLAIVPLLLHGCSCGHDFPFHLQSWLEAAQQLRHGTYPQWAFSPAWQAGEPRFIFYPPLSWMLGGLFVLLFPVNWVPVIFVWIALLCAGFSMHHLARHFGSANSALVAAAVYMTGPYMLFNALERSAYAELLAAVWLPLIFLGALRERPTVRGIALPLGLVWLTNAPSGVMASYALVLLGLSRITLHWVQHRRAHGGQDARRSSLRLALIFTGGIVLGLALVSFYLLPAAYERRHVQVAMAIIPNLRYQDNFLFAHTAYEPHNVVTHRISVIALSLLMTTIAAVAAAFAQSRQRERAEVQAAVRTFPRATAIALVALTLVVALLLFPLSAPVWEHLPNLKFLQFPWRLMTILSTVLGLALVPILRPLARRGYVAWGAAFVVALVLSQEFSHLFRQRCETSEWPSFDVEALNAGHGVPATDEYTPLAADNDIERPDNPGYWTTTGNVNAPAPGTFQNPNEIYENYDEPLPFEHTVAQRAPMHFIVRAETPETLVLNLRDYPTWRVTRNGGELSAHLQREDGLLALALPAGESSIDVRWQRTGDQKLGLLLSGCALAVFGFTFRRSRKIEADR